ncbi:MAG: hypothetical protein K1X75_01920 [Leptospirales bacterium]|nr:hypothetical protein [Leptospirales bacterium]
MLYYRLDRVFAFDDQQEQWVRRQIQAHYRWHRTTQLPAYSAFLRDLRGRVQRGLQEADLDWAQQQMTGFRNALMIRIYPDARLLLLGLGDRQLQDLPDRLADYNEELAQKAALSPEERTERSAKETVESVEEWLGSLQQDQKGELGQIARAMPDETPLRLQMNRERQAQLLAALQSPERGARTDALLRAWLLHAEASRPNYYRLAVLRWRRSFKDLALKIDQMMTAEQRQYFSARLGEWIEDLEQLSRG